MGNHYLHNLFYALPESILNNEIVLKGEETHHIKNVLRKKVDNIISVTDGLGYRYKVRIKKITRSQINVEILERMHIKQKDMLNLALAFVPLKGLKNAFIVEKGTELGVRIFLPFISAFSVNRMSERKISRFKKIAINAILQSQQYYLPEIIFNKNLDLLLEKYGNFDLILVANKYGDQNIPVGAKSVLYAVGPEGGFDKSEIRSFKRRGARLLSLGANRLRSETAAITGIIKILSGYGKI